MQNHTFMNISHISDRILTLIAEGAEHFERKEDISECQKCPLAKTRKRVIVSQKIVRKQFFILSEFPEIEDESSSSVFSPHSNSGVILNLVEKLGIQNLCYYAFALKCVTNKHTPDHNISTCVFENLRKELEMVSPQTIFCFGTRAFLALSQLNTSIRGFVSFHGGAGATPNLPYIFTFQNHKIELYLLPTALELKQFPHWRLPVWTTLAHFRQKKED